MTYKRLYEDALLKLKHNIITLGEFDEMIKPLEREIEQEPTKNDLRVDAVSREKVYYMITNGKYPNEDYEQFIDRLVNELAELPSVTPQKPTNNYLANGCIDKWEDVDGKKVEAWIVKGKMQIRHRGSIHNFSLPSVTPQEPRWIPVSERLPEIHNYSDSYLVTLKRGGVYIAMFTECNGKHWWTYDDVIAWMPLPQEYREVEG